MYLLFPFYLSREDSTLICLGTKQPSIINNANQPTKSQTHPRIIRTPSTAHPCALLSSPLFPSLPPFPHLTHHGRPPQHAHRNRQRQRHHPRRLRRRRPAQMLLPLLRRPAQTPARARGRSRRRRLHRQQSAGAEGSAEDPVSARAWHCHGLGRYGAHLAVCLYG
jgi:hypothetical protein